MHVVVAFTWPLLTLTFFLSSFSLSPLIAFHPFGETREFDFLGALNFDPIRRNI